MNPDSFTAKQKYQLALKALRPFCKKQLAIARFQAISTFAALVSLTLLSFYVYDFSPLWSLLIAPFITVFLSRSFIIEHDCGHQSFFRGRVANAITGNIFGFLNMIPYNLWKYIHDLHHSNVGNLDKRDLNPELWTMTVAEYNALDKRKQRIYRMLRSKASRLVFAPFVIFAILFRIPHGRIDRRSNIGVIVYDLLYIAVIYLLLQVMPASKLLLVYGLPLYLFWVLASYVFYSQHQFEDTYWETQDKWSYEEATFAGSSYLTAPAWFNWMSGNVGHHHIHHLISSIPNYNLSKAQTVLSGILQSKPISIFRVYHLLELKLWDEEKKKLVKFPDTKAGA